MTAFFVHYQFFRVSEPKLLGQFQSQIQNLNSNHQWDINSSIYIFCAYAFVQYGTLKQTNRGKEFTLLFSTFNVLLSLRDGSKNINTIPNYQFLWSAVVTSIIFEFFQIPFAYASVFFFFFFCICAFTFWSYNHEIIMFATDHFMRKCFVAAFLCSRLLRGWRPPLWPTYIVLYISRQCTQKGIKCKIMKE